MPPHSSTLVAYNLLLQSIQSACFANALLLARKREYKKHCLTLCLAFSAQILAILLFMSPAMASLTEPGRPVGFLAAEILMHHSLGLAVVPLFIYINLVYQRRLSPRLSMRSAMQTAAGMWAASLVLGFHIYSYLNF